MKKDLNKQSSFEQTLSNYSRYIDIVASSFNQDQYIQDLKQEGALGLLNAYNRWDEIKGPFKPYAIVYIKGAMMNFLTNNARTIRLPRNVDFKDEKFNYLSTISLQTPIGEQGSTLSDLIAQEDETPTFDASALQSLLKCLKPKELELVQKYYLSEDKITTDELGKEYNQTGQNIRLSLKKIIILKI